MSKLTLADVESAKIDSRKVEFFSDSIKLAGDLYFPPQVTSNSPAPGLIICHGYGGIKEFFLPEIAKAFAAQGFAALIFDYRGFGESDGEENRLFPEEQVADVLAAATFLRQQPEVDASSIGIYGTSFGGGVAVSAGTKSKDIGAVVCAVGIADYGRWLKSLRRHWEWIEFEKRLDADRIQRTLTGVSEVVEPEEIMVRDPHSAEHEKELRAKYPNRAFKLNLASGDAIRNFRPIETLNSEYVPALLFIGVEEDGLTPFEETVDFYEASPMPKELITLRGMTHHDLYKPQNLYGVLETVGAFFRQYLK
jgi:fermentation-respiration switch protein FrsA (DUF1100 family)